MTAVNITENPEGTDKKVLEHRKREKNESVEKVIKQYKSRIKNRPERW